MNIALFEPRFGFGGHPRVHLRDLLREMVRRGWNPILVTDPAGEKTYSDVVAQFDGRVRVFPMKAPASPARQSTYTDVQMQFDTCAAFKRAYQDLQSSTKIDFAYVMNLTRIDKVLAITGSPFGKTPFGGWLLGLKFHLRECGVESPARRSDSLYQFLFKRMLAIKTLKAPMVPDELLPGYAARHKMSQVVSIIDVQPGTGVTSMTKEEARKLLGIAPEKFVLLAYGSMAKRKGIGQLLKAAGSLPADAPIVVLLAGVQLPEVSEILKDPSLQSLRESGKVVELNLELTDEQETQVYMAADTVWLGYIGHLVMSSILVQAGLFGLPVIACKEGLLGWLTRKENLGKTVDVQSVSDTAAAIQAQMNDPSGRQACGANGRAWGRRITARPYAEEMCNEIQSAVKS